MPELDEPHASFHEAAGDQNLSRLHTGTVGFEHLLRFTTDVESVGGFHLHAVGQFERVNACLE